MNFKDLGISNSLLEAISYMGFDQPTPIQQQSIPHILEGRDILACAQTGTGKTAAFALPMIQTIAKKGLGKARGLVVVPTRELAVQINQQIQGFAYFDDVHSAAVYGGGDGLGWDQQKEALTNGTEIIIATPGKLISHLIMGHVKFDHIEFLVLDEADRMLDMGFLDDILKIISYLPTQRQNLFFSATMPPKMRQLAKTVLNDPFEVSLSISKPAEGVDQQVFFTHDDQKSPLIRKVLRDHPDFKSILVFSSTKRKVFDIVKSLRGDGYKVQGISSDLEQDEREQVLIEFTNRRLRVLVATDVLSRGIDIKDIDLVINYDVPKNAEDYVHRVGRTARAATKGMAVTLVNERDMRGWAAIERLIEREIPRQTLPEFLGAGPEYNPFKKAEGGGRKPFGNRRKKSGNRPQRSSGH
jgi:superfamily II DNA/RNA helicase